MDNNSQTSDKNIKQKESKALFRSVIDGAKQAFGFVDGVVDFAGKALKIAPYAIGGYFAYINRDKIIGTFNNIGGFIGLISAGIWDFLINNGIIPVSHKYEIRNTSPYDLKITKVTDGKEGKINEEHYSKDYKPDKFEGLTIESNKTLSDAIEHSEKKINNEIRYFDKENGTKFAMHLKGSIKEQKNDEESVTLLIDSLTGRYLKNDIGAQRIYTEQPDGEKCNIFRQDVLLTVGGIPEKNLIIPLEPKEFSDEGLKAQFMFRNQTDHGLRMYDIIPGNIEEKVYTTEPPEEYDRESFYFVSTDNVFNGHLLPYQSIMFVQNNKHKYDAVTVSAASAMAGVPVARDSIWRSIGANKLGVAMAFYDGEYDNTNQKIGNAVNIRLPGSVFTMDSVIASFVSEINRKLIQYDGFFFVPKLSTGLLKKLSKFVVEPEKNDHLASSDAKLNYRFDEDCELKDGSKKYNITYFIKVEYNTCLGEKNNFTLTGNDQYVNTTYLSGVPINSDEQLPLDPGKFTIISAYDTEYLAKGGVIALIDDPNARIVNSDMIRRSILSIKNMTGKKITITGTENWFNSVKYNSEPYAGGLNGYWRYDQKFNEKGVIGYGAHAAIQGETIDPRGLIAKRIDSMIYTTHSPYLLQDKKSVDSIHSISFRIGDSDKKYSVSFSPRSVNFFDRELKNESEARDYIALPKYGKHYQSGLKTLSISLYSPEVKVEECDMPTDNGERDKQSLPISFTIKNNTNSDITINNVQSYIEAYAKCTGTPWQFINCTIKSKESVQKKMLYNAELNEDGKLAARTDKCLAFYYSKHDLSKNNYGKFFCGDVYTFGKKKYSDDKLNININSTSDSVVIDLYEPDQVKFTGES